MTLLPDWIPNLHPFIVHFPVALLVLALFAEFTRLLFRRSAWLDRTTVALYIAGTLSLFIAYISGQRAIDTVQLTGAATSVAAAHEDWALYTSLFFLLFTPLRTVAWWRKMDTGWYGRLAITFVSFIGIGLLWQTGEQGTKLVYKHGVAVNEVDQLQERINSLESRLAEFRENAAPITGNDGSWSWIIRPGSAESIDEYFDIEGETSPEADVLNDEQGFYLGLNAVDSQWFLFSGQETGNIEGTVELNVDEFDGIFKLVHHFRNRDSYQYLRLENGLLSQGQYRDGQDHVLESREITTDNWLTLRVSASGTHFYAYLNGENVLHTHEDEMDAGMSGFYFDGNGQLKLRSISFTAIE